MTPQGREDDGQDEQFARNEFPEKSGLAFFERGNHPRAHDKDQPGQNQAGDATSSSQYTARWGLRNRVLLQGSGGPSVPEGEQHAQAEEAANHPCGGY
jgi:hypothetical protein